MAVGGVPASQEDRLWVRVVGQLTAGRTDRPFAAAEVGSRKARTLLALLALDGGGLVSVDRVIEVLWGGARPKKPAAAVATLVSRLRARLGSHAIVGRRNGYRLGRMVAVDLYEARTLVATAEERLHTGEATTALASARKAGDLLVGRDVLEDQPDAVWAERARVMRADLQRRALHAVAEAALSVDDAVTACAAAAEAVVTDPLDERACRALMRAHHATGEPARALAAYEQLRTVLGDELGACPAAPTRDLHSAILRDRFDA